MPRGKVMCAVTAIRPASELGFDSYALHEEPGFASVRQDPCFRAAVAEVAAAGIEVARAHGDAMQRGFAWAEAHVARTNWAEVVSVPERAAATPEPVGSSVRIGRAHARRKLARAQGRVDGPKAP